MKKLNGLGGFVAATLLLLLASSMITATIAEIKPAGMASTNIALESRAAKARGHDLVNAGLNGQGSSEVCEALAMDSGKSSDVNGESVRCVLDAFRASVTNTRRTIPTELHAINANTC